MGTATSTVDDKFDRKKGGFRDWFMQGARPQDAAGAKASPHHRHSWWQVMCLTGVDYFSTLGYQPGIAFAAAGVLSPIATLILVLLDAFRSTSRSTTRRGGKSARARFDLDARIACFRDGRASCSFSLLLGFVATDFVITITLSAADATEHIIHNPYIEEHFP